ncbi:MAG: bifunctional 3-hydroxydecanoyl-ACP dehydratase/trans-2-decenoyl-ACP isomerase [Oceanococcus sp.]|nr:MAG: bifunctional 3-hydroxydecanoyl-ACP dehydratase/trans-2-decenoyl-ACP isomerase [Oceanococcus sp.]
MKLSYADFCQRDHFNEQEILAFAHGQLLTNAPDNFLARLPLPPMLMVDRIIELENKGRRGRLVAERDVRVDDWFYQCHFANDPVQPGCLGVDAVWQLLGFYCGWRGGLGSGRALGCGEIEFFGQIRPHNQTVRYDIDILRFSQNNEACMAIGNATVLVDDEPIYSLSKAKSGLFHDIAYSDYPLPSAQARGGRMSN